MRKRKPILFRFYKFNQDDTYIHNSLRLFGFNWWCCYYYNQQGWFRIFGRGLKWKNTEKYGLLFSERNGFWKGISIGKWRISRLKYYNNY